MLGVDGDFKGGGIVEYILSGDGNSGEFGGFWGLVRDKRRVAGAVKCGVHKKFTIRI